MNGDMQWNYDRCGVEHILFVAILLGYINRYIIFNSIFTDCQHAFCSWISLRDTPCAAPEGGGDPDPPPPHPLKNHKI